MFVSFVAYSLLFYIVIWPLIKIEHPKGSKS